MGSPGPIDTSGKVLVLFDGVCNLCNGAVQFIIRRDPESKFLFASIQSDFGKSQLLKFGLSPDFLHSVLVIDGNTLYQKSDGALKIAGQLKGNWRLLTAFKLFPRFIRNGIYELIASSRYKVFGKKDECMIPSPDLKARFIE